MHLCHIQTKGNNNNTYHHKFDDNEHEEFKYQFTLFSQMRNFLHDIIDKSIDYSTFATLLNEFYQIDLYSISASKLIGKCCASIFKTDRDKPWKPLGVMIIFLCRIALSPIDIIHDSIMSILYTIIRENH